MQSISGETGEIVVDWPSYPLADFVFGPTRKFTVS